MTFAERQYYVNLYVVTKGDTTSTASPATWYVVVSNEKDRPSTHAVNKLKKNTTAAANPSALRSAPKLTKVSMVMSE